jgi:hypothetical protein
VYALPELHPVVEAPWFEGAPPWPWLIANREPFSFIRLSGGMPKPEVGSVIAQLVGYNQVEAEPTVEGLLATAIVAESLVLPGGVQASAGEHEINPSCCCGLEEWRAWLECLESGGSPWMGHDPAPRIEWAGEVVRVWSDGGLGLARTPSPSSSSAGGLSPSWAGSRGNCGRSCRWSGSGRGPSGSRTHRRCAAS